MTRPRIAHLITRLDLGGAQQNTLHTVRSLDRARFEPILVCGRGGLLDEEARADSSFATVFVDSLVRELSPARDLLALFELANLLRSLAPDVVHTHSSKAGILGRAAARLAGVPAVVHTYHGFGFHDGQSPPLRAAYAGLERLCAGLADELIFVSRANIEYAGRHGLLARGAPHRLIRSGVRLGDYPAAGVDAAALKASLGIGRHKPLVVSVGNLKPQKNPFDFLSAAERTLSLVPEARFVFIGDGPLRPALEARAFARGLEGKVLFPGWRRDAARWLAAADAFVLTSLWEGLPRSLVEAMKSGLACVCYACDGVTDLLRDGENGFLLRPGDARGLGERLAGLLGDEALRRRLGAAAAASIGPEFDIDGMVRAQERLYEELLRGLAAGR